MSWEEIDFETYQQLFKKEEENLGVLSSCTEHFPEEYFLTTWGFNNNFNPYLKSLKKHGKWTYWKWEGPSPYEFEEEKNE